MLLINLLKGVLWYFFFFFFKQKTAYEMRISDWSSDVCSSDLARSSDGADFWTCRPIPFFHAAHAWGGRRFDLVPENRHRGPRSRSHGRAGAGIQIGRASCRERVCQYV